MFREKNKENKQPAFLIFEKSKMKSINKKLQGKINVYLPITLLKREDGATNEQSKEGMGQRTNGVAISVSFSFYVQQAFFFFFNNSKPFDYTVSFLFYTKRLLNCVASLLNSKMFRFLIGNMVESQMTFFPTWQNYLNCRKRLLLFGRFK